MSRNPQIEAIHEARYDLETCAPGATAEMRAKLDRLLAEAIESAGSRISPRELLDALYDDYRTYRKGKRTEQWPRL
jgi:hypothetical protein